MYPSHPIHFGYFLTPDATNTRERSSNKWTN